MEKNTNFRSQIYEKSRPQIYEKEKFNIVGRCDAVDISKSEILEIKTRINIGVKVADRCQVQCYMHIKNILLPVHI